MNYLWVLNSFNEMCLAVLNAQCRKHIFKYACMYAKFKVVVILIFSVKTNVY